MLDGKSFWIWKRLQIDKNFREIWSYHSKSLFFINAKIKGIYNSHLRKYILLFSYFCSYISFSNASSSVLEKLIFSSSAFVFIHLGIFTVFFTNSFPHFLANSLISTDIYVLNLENSKLSFVVHFGHTFPSDK